MKHVVLVLILLSAHFAFTDDDSTSKDPTFKDVKVVYQDGDEQKEEDARLTFTSDRILLTEEKVERGTFVAIPFTDFTKAVYEKSAHPRWKTAVFLTPWALFSKGKKHWITIDYKKPNGNEDFVLLHVDKGNYQMIIATLEARTGKPVEKMIED